MDYAGAAAEHAADSLAFEEAANHYERALTALEVQEPIDCLRHAFRGNRPDRKAVVASVVFEGTTQQEQEVRHLV